jgi:hypothetical protein
MSHWTKCKTSVKDKELLKKALTRLGWEFTEGNFTVEQYGSKEKAEIILAKDNAVAGRNAVGLSLQEDGTWAMVGDPYHAPHNSPIAKYYRKEQQFAKDLATAYMVADAHERLEEQGFVPLENDKGVVGPDGKIRMSFQKLMG